MRLTPLAVAAFALALSTAPASPGAAPAPTWSTAKQEYRPLPSFAYRAIAGEDDRDADESGTTQPADVVSGSRILPARPIAGRPARGAGRFTVRDGHDPSASRAPPSLS